MSCTRCWRVCLSTCWYSLSFWTSSSSSLQGETLHWNAVSQTIQAIVFIMNYSNCSCQRSHFTN